jgi:glycosyltransferase involved in cell wall biosynthesis
MIHTSRKVIGIIPNVRGVGGPASFNEKLVNGLRKLGVEVTYDLAAPNLSSILVIAGTRHLGLLSSLKKKGIPIIQRLDGMNWIHRKRYTGLRYYLRSEMNNWILREIRSRYASAIIYQSEFSRDWWNKKYGNQSIPNSVIYNGVDLDQFSPPKSIDFDHETLEVIAVEGHIKNGLELGLDNVIQALNKYSKLAQKPVHLMVAGEVPNDIRVKLTTRKMIEITWCGVISRLEIAGQLKKADLFFSAELNPPCPNSVIEALASGLPVTAFESGAIRELVSDDCGIISSYGGNIWNMESANAEMMAKMLSNKLQDRAGMGKNARTRAVQMFGLDQMVDKYLVVLSGLNGR